MSLDVREAYMDVRGMNLSVINDEYVRLKYGQVQFKLFEIFWKDKSLKETTPIIKMFTHEMRLKSIRLAGY